MEINKPIRIGVDKLSNGLVTDTYSRETPSGESRVSFAELENFEPTNNDKLVTTQPFLPTSQNTVQLPKSVVKQVVVSERDGVVMFTVDSQDVWRSLDGGLTWTLVLSQEGLRSIAALPNKTVVAVGENGLVVRSTTLGDSWITLTSFTQETLQSITDVGGTGFVVVGELFVYRSNDNGLTWTRVYATGFQVAHDHHVGGTYRGLKVAFANGVYVSFAPNDTRCLISLDGISWQEVGGLPNVEWTSVVGAEVSATLSPTGRIFVAVAKNTNTCYRSIDGTTWTNHTIDTSIGAPNRQWSKVAFANGWFVAISQSENVIARSQDGLTWTIHQIDTSVGAPLRNWQAITFVSQGFPFWIIFAQGTGVIARSFDNGATWQVGDFGLPSFQWRDAVFANGRIIVVHDSTSSQVAVSPDGVNWSLTSFPSAVSQRGISFGNGRFVVSTSGTTFMHSVDGELWQSTTIGIPFGDWAFIAFHQDKFLTMRHDVTGNAETLYSYDGLLWYSSKNRIRNTFWCDAASGNGAVVMVASDSGGIARAGQDGRRWSMSSPLSVETTGVAFGQGIFLASVPGRDSFLFSSDNGLTFQDTPSVFNDRNWSDVASNGNFFVAIVKSSNVAASITYTAPSTFTVTESSAGLSVRNWNKIEYGNNVFVAVAADDWVIAESSDGVTWTEYDLQTFGTFDTNLWLSVVCGGNVFVAVATGGSNTFAVRDSSGKWSAVSNGLSKRNWQRVAYTRGVFCAIATDGTIAYSTAPETQWTEVLNAVPPLISEGGFVGHEGKFVGVYGNDTRQIIWGGEYRVDAQGTTVLVVGEQGYVARSVDGGVTWTRELHMQTTDVFRRTTDVCAVSPTTVLTTEAVESGTLNTGIVRRTVSGGVTWSRLYAGGGSLWTVGAPTETQYLVAGNGRVVRSDNSGETWQQINNEVLFHRTMVARNGQAVILGQGDYLLYDSQSEIPFTSAVSFTNSMVSSSATTVIDVIEYETSSSKYLLTDAWRFKGEHNLAYLYEYSAFKEETTVYRRQSERLYYLNQLPLTLPLVTFATQGDREFGKFIVSSTSSGEVTVRVFRPPMTQINGGQVRVSQRLNTTDVDGIVSETYYLPPSKRLPIMPTTTELEEFEQMVKGCVGTISYGVLETSTNEVMLKTRTVAACIIGVSQGVTTNGTRYLDIKFRAAREMDKSSGNVIEQFPTVPLSVGSLCFYSVQIFYSQYGYKVWHGVGDTEQLVSIPTSQLLTPDRLEEEFVFRLARLWLQRPLVYQNNAIWALPSTVTPKRTGGDSGSTFINNRLHVDVAPNMVVFESEPKSMFSLPQYVLYNKAQNEKIKTISKFTFYFGEYSRTLSLPLVEVTSVTFSPSISGFTWSFDYQFLNAEDYNVVLEIVADETVPSGSYSATVTLSNLTSETVSFEVASNGYVKGRSEVFTLEDTHWKRIEVETPDTTESVNLSFQVKPFLTPSLDTTPSARQTVSFSALAFVRQANNNFNENREYFYQLLLSPNNPNELVEPSITPSVVAVDFFVPNTSLGRFLNQIADDIKTALQGFFPSSNPTVTIKSRAITSIGQLNGLTTTSQVYYDITIAFSGTVSPFDQLSVRARQMFTFISTPISSLFLFPPAPQLFFPFPTQRIAISENNIDGFERRYWHAGLTDVNAFYAVAVTAVYDGFEESDVIAWVSARGQFDYNYETQRFLSFLFECDVRLNLAAVGKRLSYLKVYVGKFPQQSIQRGDEQLGEDVAVSGVFETISSDFDMSLLNSLMWVGVVIVDKAYAEQFDKGIFVLEGSFQPINQPLIRGGRYYFAPREAGTAMVLSGVEIGEEEFSWVGGNFDTPQSDGGGLVTENALYPNQRDMPPYISGAWVSRTRRSFEPFFVSVKFRITGALFQRGVVQYRRGTTITTYKSFIIPNGAMSATLRTTELSPPQVTDRVVYEAVPTGIGAVVNPNGTLSENLGRLVKSEKEVRIFRDRISSGVSLVVAGRRYFFMMRDEGGEITIPRFVSVRSAVAQGVPQYSFFDASFERQTNLFQFETQVAGDIVSAVRNRYNDFSENLRVLLVQDVQSKLLSVQEDGAPIVIQEFDGISSPFPRAATLTPYGICLISPQGLYLINDNQVQMLSAAIDTLWRKEFDDTQAVQNGDYPKESSATVNPFVAQGFYDIETRRFYAMRNAKAYVYDFEKKCWFVNSLVGGLTNAFAILPARVLREENEALVVPSVSFDTPEVIQNYTRDMRYELALNAPEYEADSLMTTNVFVAPPDLEYQVKRVSVVFSGGTSTALVERKCQIDVIEASIGNDGNVSIDGGNVTNIFEFDMGNSAAERRHFDVPVNVGKNLRAFAVRVKTQNVRVVVEELNVTVIPRRRPISQGVATLNVFEATPPVVVSPVILPDVYSVPIENSLQIPLVFSVRLSNPLLPTLIRDAVLYDILLYLNEERTVFFAAIENLTTAQVVESSVSSTLFVDITNTPVLFQGGQIYYGVARCRYLSSQATTLFSFATRLTAPTLTGFPTSTEVPTSAFFQGTAQRGVANANATEAEFEWKVGVNPQSNVNVFYNSSGNATGTFTLPTINSPTLIRVRARSKNNLVIGEWSAFVDVDVTLLRPSPIFTVFSASTLKVALQAEPTEVVRFTVIGNYPADVFGGVLSVNILRLDTLTVIGSLAIPSVNTSSPTPFSLTADFAIGDMVTSQAPIQFVARVTRPDGQTFNSVTQTVEFITRPSLEKVTVMFNPNQKVYNKISPLTLAQGGQAVEMWESRAGLNLPIRQLGQSILSSQPVYKLLPSTSTLPTQRFVVSSFYGRSLEGISGQSYLPVLNDPKRNKISMIVVGSTNNSSGMLVQAAIGFPFYRMSFAASGGNSWEFSTPAASPISYSVFNALCIFLMTFERNTTNGFKLYDSLVANPTVPVATQNTANTDFANGNAAPHLNVVVFTAGSGVREVGHIIIFEDTVLSGSQIQDWFNWLNAIYKL